VLTVKTHVHNILNKLNMTKRVQAALFAASQPDIFDKEPKDKTHKTVPFNETLLRGNDGQSD